LEDEAAAELEEAGSEGQLAARQAEIEEVHGRVTGVGAEVPGREGGEGAQDC
jgi:hypothetical protein